MPIQPTDNPEIKSMKWIDKLVNRPSYEAAVVKWFDYVPARDQG